MSTGPEPPAAATTPPRTAALWLVPAAAICGLGLGALVLASTAVPADAVATLPPLTEQPPRAAPVPAPEPRAWPAAFGLTPIPQPPPEPVAHAAPPADPVPPLEAHLRGLALDDDGGWALIEIDGQVALIRPGSPLGPNHSVAEIQADGVVIVSPDGPHLLGFAVAAPDRPPATSVRESLARSYLRGARDLFDMPVALPPAGYVPGPGLSGMTDR